MSKKQKAAGAVEAPKAAEQTEAAPVAPKGPDIKALRSAVKDINTVIKLDPPLNEEADEATLRKDLAEVMGDIRPEDKLADTTRATLKALTPAKAAKVPKAGNGKKRSAANAAGRDFVWGLIQQGKFTAKDIKAKAMAKFPEWNVSSLSTILSDCKNSKYNPFDKLVKKGKDGILHV